MRDIFRYFEKGRLVRKKTRQARKAINGALRFARKKKTYPSNKTAEALNALGQIQDELEYTRKVIVTAFEESETIIKLISQEKVGETIPLVEKARDRFKNHDLEGGMELLRAAQENLKSKFLLCFLTDGDHRVDLTEGNANGKNRPIDDFPSYLLRYVMAQIVAPWGS